MKRLILLAIPIALALVALSVEASSPSSRYVLHDSGVDTEGTYSGADDNYDANVAAVAIFPEGKLYQTVDNIVVDVVWLHRLSNQWQWQAKGTYYHRGCLECASIGTGPDYTDAALWPPYYGMICRKSNAWTSYYNFTGTDVHIFTAHDAGCR